MKKVYSLFRFLTKNQEFLTEGSDENGFEQKFISGILMEHFEDFETEDEAIENLEFKFNEGSDHGYNWTIIGSYKKL